MDKRVIKITKNEFRTDAEAFLDEKVYPDYDLGYKIKYVLNHLYLMSLDIEFDDAKKVIAKIHDKTFNIECCKCRELSEMKSIENGIKENKYVESVIYNVIGE